MDKVRMVLAVDADVPDLMIELAGGERKRGEWLATHLRDFAAGKYITVEECERRIAEAVAREFTIEERLARLEKWMDENLAKLDND